ncbi:MAG: M23 family metallopeptidase [Alphaproteobacteria bacterium]|nr:MAG: M23 family metallopeptidase [Alphaproteobacteria bacterium]
MRGGPWVAVYEPRLERGHRRVVYATQGKAKIPGRFAIDWMRPTSSSAQGPDLVLEEGATIEVLSIADGVIAATRDGVPEPGPNERPDVSLEDATGNYISLRITPDRYVFYEHLLPGLLVRPGDQVKRGQVIAQVGSTGQANRPHLHLHLADSDSPLDAEGFPYALEEAEVIGTYRSIEEFDRGAPWEKLSRPSTLRSIPGPNVVIQFPK